MQITLHFFTVFAICLMVCEPVNAFVCHSRPNRSFSTALRAVPNPFRAIRNTFRKPKVTANFPVNGKKVKLTAEKTEQLTQKYADIEDVGDLAYEVIKDLELVDTKWRKYPKKAER
jgi:hypothetical protein